MTDAADRRSCRTTTAGGWARCSASTTWSSDVVSDAEANRRVRQHRHHLHLRQRLDPRRAPPPRPDHRGRQGRRRQVRPLRGLVAGAADDRGPRLPDRAQGRGRREQRRPRADDRSTSPARSRSGAAGRLLAADGRAQARRCSTAAASCIETFDEPARRAALHRGPHQALPLRPPGRTARRASTTSSSTRGSWRASTTIPRYDAIKAILRGAAEDSPTAAGASCRKPVPPLPQPGR